jgi:hypothetical protein
MVYVVEMGSFGMIYLPSSMKIGKGVQAVLKFFLNYLNGCNFGITYGRDF